jgi:hypothetical protein
MKPISKYFRGFVGRIRGYFLRNNQGADEPSLLQLPSEEVDFEMLKRQAEHSVEIRAGLQHCVSGVPIDWEGLRSTEYAERGLIPPGKIEIV